MLTKRIVILLEIKLLMRFLLLLQLMNTKYKPVFLNQILCSK